MDNLELFTHLERKVQDLELKIDAIILRLQICQKQGQKNNLELNTSIDPLTHYVGVRTTGSCMPSPINKNEVEDNLFSQRWYSQAEQKRKSNFKKIEPKENVLDSKSFGMIKRSLMINSQQIQEIRDRMIEMEKNYTKKLMDIEEGFEVVARLSQLMENKIEDMLNEREQKQEEKEKEKGKKQNRKKNKMKDIIQKYQTSSKDKEDIDFLEKYL